MRVKSVLIGILLAFIVTGCASPGRWSAATQERLDAFGNWADTWVGGALAEAPLIIAGVAAIAGQSSNVQAAQDAVKAAQAALGTYHAIVATGSGDVSKAEAALLSAFDHVSSTIGAIKAVKGDLSLMDPLRRHRLAFTIRAMCLSGTVR